MDRPCVLSRRLSVAVVWCGVVWLGLGLGLGLCQCLCLCLCLGLCLCLCLCLYVSLCVYVCIGEVRRAYRARALAEAILQKPLLA